ncbi:LysR family transcriptional regulator [Roseobacter sp. YSTF-M11]|uniref:LysR family transcriptional regulator n=1 Tax=Roseobacter insulae TaxID=2859783 RepID=A0A9X1K1E5_9RHOB|nr:LysR family transcriptional regulator [Roseobacter insulae]MBW4709124.1 LysR family transcriptional regulator [Roseobacter insulae]
MVSKIGNLGLAKRALISALGDVDIRLLRIFVTVTECGGFAASELELNIGRSTISKHIADLELRIGLKLCNRGPSGFSLTSEGEQVLLATRHLLSKIDDFQSEIDDIHANLAGTLRVGIFDQSSTNPRAHIHEAIRHFDDAAPDVSLEIVLDTPSALESRVTDGALELAIVPVYRQSSSLRYQVLYDEYMTLYCGEKHELYDTPVTGSLKDLDLTQYKYAGYSFNSPNMMAGRNLGFVRAARAKEEEALALLIQSGRYIGYLADHVAETFFDKGKVRKICPDETSYMTRFGAITRRKPEPDRKTQRFLECLTAAHQKS